MNKDTVVLGIETSCDETSASVVKNGKVVLSNVIYSQINIHKKFGGVVPEIASRNHIEAIGNIVKEALDEASITLDDIDVVAATYGPGLVGALLVGLSYGKALAYGKGIPFVGVNHIEGHISANYLDGDFEPPFICLIASGGHSHIVFVKDYGEYEVLGRTVDDAAGEAFDKVARALGLGYPGGPKIDEISKNGDPYKYNFPKSFMEKDNFDFSFSGLKTAVINQLHKEKQKGSQIDIADYAASFQMNVVDVLSSKLIEAAKYKNINKISIAGGVASNSFLRERLLKLANEEGFMIHFPKQVYCTDNGAMIASAGYFDYIRGKVSGLDLNAIPYLKLF
ncbi:tRNA (adenosine(37)-N6)-threonylcarbamoyltransferase complex transferase subunit TsaD [Thermoanaerobacterium thermosaccharolyticum]|uniref:tRNA (adenosine(37)-N6)-threonylcarbamoyltransferase complex transferase subunit TsaD n=1 Tax=Thermoanaerobacterium thermosaccharolyticum TaxID=1517 RepID=UPI000C08BC42|nr:tRNA (adenosine(37)-N6)-threonylcarbamoyltransferase complex transferase subunit TsaD [Thermoanaerobacterium thermosaccharolyticum]PHO06839.1 tRNA (adenosine(37)-N6)-threonylcarbamoyltransferase complex transferase subunit TsaD [Thermoanaerobacterium thermosaccharolyticum]